VCQLMRELGHELPCLAYVVIRSRGFSLWAHLPPEDASVRTARKSQRQVVVRAKKKKGQREVVRAKRRRQEVVVRAIKKGAREQPPGILAGVPTTPAQATMDVTKVNFEEAMSLFQ
jgi:hypothetical protein